jgi:hypothetical protein
MRINLTLKNGILYNEFLYYGQYYFQITKLHTIHIVENFIFTKYSFFSYVIESGIKPKNFIYYS